jgi:hypothetical protein
VTNKLKMLRAAAFGAGLIALAGCVAAPDNRPNPPPVVACPYGSCVPRLQQFYYYQPYVPYYYGPGSALVLQFGGGGSHPQYHPRYHRHHRR